MCTHTYSSCYTRGSRFYTPFFPCFLNSSHGDPCMQHTEIILRVWLVHVHTGCPQHVPLVPVGLECARWSPFVRGSILGRKGGRHMGGDPVMKLWLFGGWVFLRTAWWLFLESSPSLSLDTCLAPRIREAVSKGC